MTEKLFYTDSHQQEFTAEVVSCRPCDNGYEAVLSRTAFFPEGGGQAADTGVIDGIRVYDVQEKGEQIFHYLEGELEEGKTVTGQIDWDKRFSRMQQHSGEHIVSGIVHARFGYDNVGFHLNDELCTLDLSGPLTKEELRDKTDLRYSVKIPAYFCAFILHIQHFSTKLHCSSPCSLVFYDYGASVVLYACSAF